MNGVVEAASPSTRALGTDGRLGLMLTELRLPTVTDRHIGASP